MRLFVSVLFCFCAYLNAYYEDLPIDFGKVREIREQLSVSKQETENLWNAFKENREFQLFHPGKTDQELKREFKELHKIRKLVWAMPGYEMAQNLVEADLIRAPGCGAFAYNNTVDDYNASTIWLYDKCYIACEGPRSKDVPSFFKLLARLHVTHLVRLTNSYDGWLKKCHPYWDGLITELNGKAYLNVPTDNGVHLVQAFHLDHWKDHQGFDCEELLTWVLQVRDSLEETNGLLVVHCSAGVGRTGTFLAALAIIDAIDRRDAFSIEEIVYRLSLQRVYCVAKWEQYKTLYRLAEVYLQSKNKIGY